MILNDLPGILADEATEAARQRLGSRGLISNQIEEFRFTNFRALKNESVRPSAVGEIQETTHGLSEIPWSTTEHRSSHLEDLIEATASRPRAFEIGRDEDRVSIDTALEAVGDGTPVNSTLRQLRLESGSAILLDRHRIQGDSFLSLEGTSIILGPGARLHHIQIVEPGPRGCVLRSTRVAVDRDSEYVSTQVILGGSFLRNETHVDLIGEGGSTSLQCVYLADSKSFSEHVTDVQHLRPHCTSTQLYHGILGGHSHGVFTGGVTVGQGAQQTNAAQRSRNLLLSDDARVNSQPNLEIHANDVKCSHGASIGQMDPDVVFYMRVRGIPLDGVRSMLTRAFAATVLDESRGLPEDLRSMLDQSLSGMLDPMVGLDDEL